MQRNEKWTDFLYSPQNTYCSFTNVIAPLVGMVYEAHSRNSDSQLLFISLSITCSMPGSIPYYQFNPPPLPPILEMWSMICSFFGSKIISHHTNIHFTKQLLQTTAASKTLHKLKEGPKLEKDHGYAWAVLIMSFLSHFGHIGFTVDVLGVFYCVACLKWF